MKDCGSYWIYVPQNCASTTDAVIYYPGAGGAHGSGYDSETIEAYIAKNPDNIVIINRSCSHNTQAIYSALQQIQSQRNMTIRNVNFLSHSAGQNSAVVSAAAGASYGFNVKYMSVLDSAYCLSPERFHVSTEAAKALKAAGTTAVFFDQSNTGLQNLRYSALINEGVPILYVKCNTGISDWGYNHDFVNKSPVRSGLIDLFSGDTDHLTPDPKMVSYEYYTFDYSKKSWVKISKNQAEKILSDVGYIRGAVEQLKNLVTSSSLVEKCNVSLPHGSTTESPEYNIRVYEKFYSCVLDLSSKLIRELTAFANAGDEYDRMDHMLESQAADLLDKFKTPASSEKYSVPDLDSKFVAKLEEALGFNEEEEKPEENNEEEETTIPASNNHNNNYAGGGGSYGGAAAALSGLTTAGALTQSLENTSDEPINATVAPEGTPSYIGPATSSGEYSESPSIVEETEEKIEEPTEIEDVSGEDQVIGEEELNPSGLISEEEEIPEEEIEEPTTENRKKGSGLLAAGLVTAAAAGAGAVAYNIHKKKQNDDMSYEDDEFNESIDDDELSESIDNEEI